MSLAIAVDTVRVRLAAMDGGKSEADLYLHTVSPHEFRHETVGDRLNDPDSDFLPFEVEGRVRLIALASLSYVEQLDAPPEIERLNEIGALRQPVGLRLVSGELLRGDLIYEANREQARVSDLLNSDLRFLLLVGEDRVLFVRRGAIEQAEV